jgi:hypothetical protein
MVLHRLPQLLLFFAKYIVYLIGLTLLIAGVTFLLGGSLQSALPIFLLVCVLTIALTGCEFYYIYSLSIKKIIAFILICNFIIVASTIIAASVYDKSWDGMAYHQMAIVKLEEGWNPVYEALPLELLKTKHFKEGIILNTYVNHYPKAHEIFAALWVGVTGKLESGKVFNILVILAAFCSVYYLLLGFPKMGKRWAFTIAIAAALNPIALSQLFSYYIDGAIGSLLTIFIASIILLYRTHHENENGWPFYIIIFLLIIILCNMKFTGLVYTILFCFLYSTFLIVQKQFLLLKRFLMISITAGIMAVGIIGFNPYITNVRDYGHPFHPIAGKHKMDIISPHMPVQLLEANRFERFINSTFSESASLDSRTSGKHLKWKIPFVVRLSEIKALQGEGIRLGGFGVLWSGILLISLIFVIVGAYVQKRNERWYMLALLLTVIISVAINPESWWSRFVPQLWLLPIIVCTFLIFSGKSVLINIGKSIVIVVIMNLLIVAAVAFSSAIKTTIRTETEFAKMRKLKKPILVYFDMFPMNSRKLHEKMIPFIQVDSLAALPCSTPHTVLRMDFCY